VRRQIGTFIAIALLFFSTIIRVFGQETSAKQNPAIPSDVLGSQLIAWSQMQKPEPVMQRQFPDSPVQRFDELSNYPKTLIDRTNTDRTNNDGNSFVPWATNGEGEISETGSKH
jgi:hypothetical protein